MTKKEIDKEKYLEIGKHRMKARKEKRKQKYADKIQQKEKTKRVWMQRMWRRPILLLWRWNAILILI